MTNPIYGRFTDNRIANAHATSFISDRVIAWRDYKNIHLFDIEKQSFVGKLEHSMQVESFIVLTNGMLAVQTDWFNVNIWDIGEQKMVRSFNTTKRHMKTCFLQALPNGHLASLSQGGEISTWNPFSDDHLVKQIDKSISSERGYPFGIGVLSNGYLVTGFIEERNSSLESKINEGEQSNHRSIFRIWNLKNGELVQTFFSDPNIAANFLVMSNDNLLVGFKDSSIQIYDTAQAAWTIRVQGPLRNYWCSFVQHPSGYLLSVSGRKEQNLDYRLHVWDPEDGKLIQTHVLPPTDNDRCSFKLAVSPDGRLAMTGHTSFDRMNSEKPSNVFPNSLLTIS